MFLEMQWAQPVALFPTQSPPKDLQQEEPLWAFSVERKWIVYSETVIEIFIHWCSNILKIINNKKDYCFLVCSLLCLGQTT